MKVVTPQLMLRGKEKCGFLLLSLYPSELEVFSLSVSRDTSLTAKIISDENVPGLNASKVLRGGVPSRKQFSVFWRKSEFEVFYFGTHFIYFG